MISDDKPHDHGRGHSHHHDHPHGVNRDGARQPEAFNPARAALLDDPRRFEYLSVAQVLRILDAPPHTVVIDFGTGTGTFAIEIARLRPDLHIVALDEQSGMLELLRAKPEARRLKNLEATLTDEIARFAGTADRILGLNVLHELGDAALSQIKSLLKPSGVVMFIDWDSTIDRPVGPPKDHTYNAAEARKRLEDLGFHVEQGDPTKYHFVLRALRIKPNVSA
ncbi:MAG: class I SAM-dependent methyltransferase [Candidatus Binataceae bacterium]